MKILTVAQASAAHRAKGWRVPSGKLAVLIGLVVTAVVCCGLILLEKFPRAVFFPYWWVVRAELALGFDGGKLITAPNLHRMVEQMASRETSAAQVLSARRHQNGWVVVDVWEGRDVRRDYRLLEISTGQFLFVRQVDYAKSKLVCLPGVKVDSDKWVSVRVASVH